MAHYKRINNDRGKNMKTLALVMRLGLLLGGMSGPVHAQAVIGVWGGYTYFPYSEFSDSDAPAGVELQISSWQTGAAFPLAFAEGRTVILNSVTYDVVNIEYKDPLSLVNKIDHMHSISYTMFLIQELSEKWQLVAVATPGLASDFEGELSTDDISFTAVLGAKYDFSDKFSLGGGAAYQRNFGDPLPMPFVLVEWAISPRLALSALLPMNATVMYSPKELFDVGVFGEIGGNQYHGDPDKFGVNNPLLKYSVVSAGPMARVHFTKWAHLTMKGGYTFLRRFEFFDGSDEAETFNLKQSWYVQGGLVFGM